MDGMNGQNSIALVQERGRKEPAVKNSHPKRETKKVGKIRNVAQKQ